MTSPYYCEIYTALQLECSLVIDVLSQLVLAFSVLTPDGVLQALGQARVDGMVDVLSDNQGS